jgi:hypothetical protein
MPTSDKQIAANRLNALKSHGPKNTKSTRTNATKHGLLAAGITELDDGEGYRTMLRDLVKETNPVGTIEKFLVESIALEMVKSRRARRLEGEYITDILNPLIYKPGVPCAPERPVLDPGLPPSMKLESVQPLVGVFPRYEGASLQRLFRILHEFERLQRMRHGESLLAPAALDVSVHHDTGMQSDTIPLPQEEAPGGKEDTAIERVALPPEEGEVLGDQEVKD